MRFSNIPTTGKVRYDSLDWATSPVAYNELDQVTDNYVVSARGFTFDDQIYLDKWAVNGGHESWWISRLSDNFDADDWEKAGDDNTLYWSINGSGAIIITNPPYPKIDGTDAKRVRLLLDALQVPDDARVTWTDGGDGRESGKARNIRKHVPEP